MPILIFINDIPEVAQTPVRLFADDTKTFSVINNEHDSKQLQLTTDNCNWSPEWKLKFNSIKYKHLHIGKKKSMNIDTT